MLTAVLTPALPDVVGVSEDHFLGGLAGKLLVSLPFLFTAIGSPIAGWFFGLALPNVITSVP